MEYSSEDKAYKIGNYIITEKMLGEGSFGQVREAYREDKYSNEKYAAKIIPK
jgi:hypothetical protein